MFGTWISDVQQALLAKFPANRAYDAEDLKSPQMPTAVGHFLRHALKRRAARMEFSVESEWFDSDAPEVLSAFEAYRKALTSTARYPQAIWKTSLERGIQFVITHIANPAAGLVAFVFGDSSDPVPIIRIAERLAYFGSHTELRETILELLDKMKVSEIGPDDLRATVLKADRSLVKDFEPQDWVNHLQPLYEIAGALSAYDKADAALPTDLLKTFFESKNCEEIVNRLEAVESVKGVHTVTADVLRRATGEKSQPPTVEPEETEDEVVHVTRMARNDIHREEESTVVPRWMQFASGGKDTEKSQSPKRTSSPPPMRVEDPSVQDDPVHSDAQGSESPVKIGQRAPVPDDLGVETSGDGVEGPDDRQANVSEVAESVPRWTQFRSTSPQPASNQADTTGTEEQVMGRLNAVQRAWYINHLFGSDRARWKVVMGLLADARDWGEASEIIASEVFERHGVDIYSRPAVDFTNAVEARFR